MSVRAPHICKTLQVREIVKRKKNLSNFPIMKSLGGKHERVSNQSLMKKAYTQNRWQQRVSLGSSVPFSFHLPFLALLQRSELLASSQGSGSIWQPLVWLIILWSLWGSLQFQEKTIYIDIFHLFFYKTFVPWRYMTSSIVNLLYNICNLFT